MVPHWHCGRLLAAVFVCSTTLVSVDAHADEPVDAGRVDALVERLGDARYDVREASDEELREIGIGAADALARAFRNDDDYEMRLRIQRIAEHIYFWDRVLGKNGFLGISHQKYTRNSPCFRMKDSRIPPDISAFSVENVIEGTSAERAGIQKCDIIVAVNGVTLPSNAVLTDFADQIRGKKPGTEMVFEFFRERERITRTIKIGHRPAQYYLLRNTPEDLKRQYQAAVDTFPQWWVERFGAWNARVAPSGAGERDAFLPLPPATDHDDE